MASSALQVEAAGVVQPVAKRPDAREVIEGAKTLMQVCGQWARSAEAEADEAGEPPATMVMITFWWRRWAHATQWLHWKRNWVHFKAGETLGDLRRQLAPAFGSTPELAAGHDPEVWRCDGSGRPEERYMNLPEASIVLGWTPATCHPTLRSRQPNGEPVAAVIFTFPPQPPTLAPPLTVSPQLATSGLPGTGERGLKRGLSELAAAGSAPCVACHPTYTMPAAGEARFAAARPDADDPASKRPLHRGSDVAGGYMRLDPCARMPGWPPTPVLLKPVAAAPVALEPVVTGQPPVGWGSGTGTIMARPRVLFVPVSAPLAPVSTPATHNLPHPSLAAAPRRMETGVPVALTQSYGGGVGRGTTSSTAAPEAAISSLRRTVTLGAFQGLLDSENTSGTGSFDGSSSSPSPPPSGRSAFQPWPMRPASSSAQGVGAAGGGNGHDRLCDVQVGVRVGVVAAGTIITDHSFREPICLGPTTVPGRSPRAATPPRKFTCTWPDCGKSFRRQTHLRRHVNIHTGEQQFHCTEPGCSRVFSRIDNVTQHRRTHDQQRLRAAHANFRKVFHC